jgi:hypothetical protein
MDTSTVVGLRDRAVIGVMTYALARIGAVVAVKTTTRNDECFELVVRRHLMALAAFFVEAHPPALTFPDAGGDKILIGSLSRP